MISSGAEWEEGRSTRDRPQGAGLGRAFGEPLASEGEAGSAEKCQKEPTTAARTRTRRSSFASESSNYCRSCSIGSILTTRRGPRRVQVETVERRSGIRGVDVMLLIGDFTADAFRPRQIGA